MGLATAFTGTEGQYRAWLKKNRFLAEKNNKDGEYAAVRNLPLTSLTSSSTGTVHGYDNHLKKAIDSSSYADMIPRKDKDALKPQVKTAQPTEIPVSRSADYGKASPSGAEQRGQFITGQYG